MIRVLHVFGQMHRGGAEMRTVELMPLLTQKGVQFDYCTLTSEQGHLDEKIRRLGGEVFPCPLRPGVLSFGRRFVRFLKQSNYDIVQTHVHYCSGYIVHLAHKAGIKSRIVHFRITEDGRVLSPCRRIYRKIMHKMIDKNATSVLAVCRAAMEFGWSKDWRQDERCRVIYNGLDLSGYRYHGNEREAVLKELYLPDESKLIINVGRFQPQKAHNILLDVAAKIINSDSDAHFLLAGVGELRQSMESKAKELGIDKQVHFLGLRTDIPRLLKASDCFVLSSRFEGLPGVVLEAVAANLPVVATDLPGVREIAEHTDLITMVPIGDSDAICKQVLKITRKGKPHLCAGTPFPLEFDLRRCAEKLFEVYTSQVG